jgi:predicted RNase H-like HicB family nuclease
MTTYNVIYEAAADGSWSARATELPVYAVGDTREQAEREIRDAIALYLEDLTRTGSSVPAAHSVVSTVTV